MENHGKELERLANEEREKLRLGHFQDKKDRKNTIIVLKFELDKCLSSKVV